MGKDRVLSVIMTVSILLTILVGIAESQISSENMRIILTGGLMTATVNGSIELGMGIRKTGIIKNLILPLIITVLTLVTYVYVGKLQFLVGFSGSMIIAFIIYIKQKKYKVEG